MDKTFLTSNADGAAHRKVNAASDALGKHTVNVTIKYKTRMGKSKQLIKTD